MMDNQALRKLARQKSNEILLIEHRRAHNICIELAGIRMPFPAIKVPSLAPRPDFRLLSSPPILPLESLPLADIGTLEPCSLKCPQARFPPFLGAMCAQERACVCVCVHVWGGGGR